MFSQFRNAVEQLAQQPIRVLDASSSVENQGESAPRAQSLDMQATRSTSPLSSSQLAESALSSLRKSLASQRSNSGSSTTSSKTPATSPPPPEPRPHKSNLEERLRRATYAIGDVSGSSTPQRSSRVASPSPSPMVRNRLKQVEQSPASTPLPGSPVVTPAKESEKKLEQPAELSLEDKESSAASPPIQPTEVNSAPVIEPPPLVQTPAPTEILSTGQVKEDNVKALELVDSTGPDPQSLESMKETESAADASAKDTSTKEAASEDTAVKESFIEETPAPDAAPEVPDVHVSAEVPSSSSENENSSMEENAPHETSVETVSPENTPFSGREDADNQPASSPIPDIEPPFKVEEVKLEPSEFTTAMPLVVDHSAEVESLQARLKQVEQRFSDVSTSFKRLQAEKLAADAILKEVTPLEGIKDANALREFFTNLKTKDQVFQDEIKRLNQKLELQEDRLEEVRDTHKLESHSLSEEVKKLRNQSEETEALFQAAQRATTHAEEAVDKQKEAFSQLQKEVDSAKNTAKEEEEKRVKAISLLKTVRQKLVKAEKDKDDAMRELSAVKERERGDKDKEQTERLNFQHELESLNASHEKATANLKAQFNKDFTSMKDRYEQEISAIRGQFELDLATTKSTHAKALDAKASQITTLENSLNNVTRDKNAFFDQLQLRQAEVESAQAHLESLQHQNTEFQFQLRESNDRLALLKEEYQELLREHDTRSRDPVPSADEIARMVSAAEAKYEVRLAEMKRNIAILEKERYDAEADWSRKLKEKMKDLEDLKRAVGSATRTREAEENVVARLEAELMQAMETSKNFERQASELPHLREQIHELQRSGKDQEQEISVKIMVLEKQIEESKAREMQLKQSNKTLRDELRKVQSSAALLERQRNPGVGYWTTRVGEGHGAPESPRMPASSPALESPSRVSSPAPNTATSTKDEEEVNLEYLRNVILQFLEHKEMRPNLVKVLSIILHFTPQETRRLIAKV